MRCFRLSTRAAMSASGRTALHIAAASRGDDVDAMVALSPSSDPSARDAQGHTALMITARNGAANCIGALLPLSDARD
jgi:ankyrin repeat protein